MAYQAVIFDLDGTLLDTLEDIGTAANRVLKRFGRNEYPIAAYKTLVGDGVSMLFQRAWAETKNDADLLRRAVEAFQEEYAVEWNKRSKPYDGIESLLIRLNESKLTLGVLSNKPDRFTKQCIEHYFPKIHFAAVEGQKADVPRKPDPAGVFMMASDWKLRTEDIAYIGDTNTDMETAVSSGCCAIGVSWGFRTVAELERSGARRIFDSPSILGDYLLS